MMFVQSRREGRVGVGRWLMAMVLLTGCDVGYEPIGEDAADEGGSEASGSSEGNDTSEGTGESAGETTVVDTGTEGETGGLITNACGSFDPNDTHGIETIPQDPDDPEIIAACTALCEVALAGIAGCTTSAADCLTACKMRSCDVCPGTLAPLVDCETAMFGGEGCTCIDGGVECPTPAGCSDLALETGFCGG